MPLEIVWKQLKREKCVFVDKNGVGTRIVWRVTRQMALTARAPRPSRPSAVVCRAVGICFFFCRQSCVGLCSRVSNRCPASEWNKAPADGRAKNALFSVCAESQFVCSWPPWPSGCFYKEISECCVSQCFVWRVDIFRAEQNRHFSWISRCFSRNSVCWHRDRPLANCRTAVCVWCCYVDNNRNFASFLLCFLVKRRQEGTGWIFWLSKRICPTKR